MYYVYVLYSPSKKIFYKGITGDLDKRYQEHVSGASQFTKSVQDWELAYWQVFINKKDALIEEKFLKSGKGRNRLKYLLRETLKQLEGSVA
jgi:putative endonuclease